MLGGKDAVGGSMMAGWDDDTEDDKIGKDDNVEVAVGGSMMVGDDDVGGSIDDVADGLEEIFAGLDDEDELQKIFSQFVVTKQFFVDVSQRSEVKGHRL